MIISCNGKGRKSNAVQDCLDEVGCKRACRTAENQHDAIVKHLKQLENNPRVFGAEKLKGRDEYKLRVGSYRIIYDINDANKEITIYIIDDRKQVYKRLKRK